MFILFVGLVGLAIAWHGVQVWRSLTVRDAVTQTRLTYSTRLAVWSRETVARFAIMAFLPSGYFDARRPIRGRRAVLLVPEPGQSRAALAFLHIALWNDGYGVWPMRLADANLPLHEHADAVALACKKVLRWTNASHLDIVAFGAGGIATAMYLRQAGTQHAVRRLISIATPWAGTANAIHYPGRLAERLRPQADLLATLRPLSTPVVSLYCPEDPVVVPATSAIANADHAVAIPIAGHVAMLFSARTVRTVRERLRVERLAA